MFIDRVVIKYYVVYGIKYYILVKKDDEWLLKIFNIYYV